MELSTSRPRVLGWLRSAAYLDGDWGTSIAYVLGIAFFHAGYFSGFHLLMMLVFMTLIALNYITICRIYPNGGGVYASVRYKSRIIAVIGALLLSADFVITVSLSVIEACHYFGLSNPEIWAIGIIIGIGILNWFGPRHAGSVAIVISSATFAALLVIVALALPDATKNVNIVPAPGGFFANWNFFVVIILAISGIESISNMTGVMKDPIKNSRRAILSVLTKISIVTIVLGLAMLAIPNLSQTEHKEDMIRYLGEFYVGNWFGPIIGFVLGFLLISAGNTAIGALTSLQFLMSVDGELPTKLRKLNNHGVPIIPLITSTLIPVIVLIFVHDVITLAALYAIGVVGAITIDIGSTCTDKNVKLSKLIRGFMLISAVILVFVEVTIAIEKPKALIFASSILILGLGAREFARRKRAAAIPALQTSALQPKIMSRTDVTPFILVAVSGRGHRLLRQACEDTKLRNGFLFVLNVKEIAVAGALPDKVPEESFVNNKWMIDICDEFKVPYKVISVISNEVGYTIAEQAATLGVERLIIGATQRSLVNKALRGDIIRIVSELLPEEIQLTIYRS